VTLCATVADWLVAAGTLVLAAGFLKSLNHSYCKAERGIWYGKLGEPTYGT